MHNVYYYILTALFYSMTAS